MTDIRPTFPELLRVFARIGLLSFGGPAGQIALKLALVRAQIERVGGD